MVQRKQTAIVDFGKGVILVNTAQHSFRHNSNPGWATELTVDLFSSGSGLGKHHPEPSRNIINKTDNPSCLLSP
jgi:hypothetical protein